MTYQVTHETYKEILEDREECTLISKSKTSVTVQIPEPEEYVPEGWQSSWYYIDDAVEANIFRYEREGIVYYKAVVSARNRVELILENCPEDEYPEDMFCSPVLPDDNSAIFLNYQKAVEFCQREIGVPTPHQPEQEETAEPQESSGKVNKIRIKYKAPKIIAVYRSYSPCRRVTCYMTVADEEHARPPPAGIHLEK